MGIDEDEDKDDYYDDYDDNKYQYHSKIHLIWHRWSLG